MACKDMRTKISTLVLTVIFVLAGMFLGNFFAPVEAGVPDDSYTIERYHSENWTSVSTTSTTYQDKTTVSFTPSANSSFLLISDCVVSARFSRDPVKARFIEGSNTYNEILYTPKQDNSESSFTVHKVFNLTGGADYTFKNQFASSAGDNVSIRDATLTAIQLSSNTTAEYNAVQSTGNTAYTDALTLNFTVKAVRIPSIASKPI
ncbi:hypothetical protein ACFLYI_01625 [Chloroflexota bacterium]